MPSIWSWLCSWQLLDSWAHSSPIVKILYTTFRLFQSNNIQNGLFLGGAQIGGSVQPTWELGCAAAIPNEVEGSRLGPASRPMTRSHRHPPRSVPARSAPGPTDSDPVGHRAEVAAVPAKAKRLTRRVRPTFPISFVFRNFPSGFQRFFAISRHGRASGVWAVGLRFISVKLLSGHFVFFVHVFRPNSFPGLLLACLVFLRFLFSCLSPSPFS